MASAVTTCSRLKSCWDCYSSSQAQEYTWVRSANNVAVTTRRKKATQAIQRTSDAINVSGYVRPAHSLFVLSLSCFLRLVVTATLLADLTHVYSCA